MLLAHTQSIKFKMNKRKYPKMKLKFDGKGIEEAEHVKYLGLIVDQQMTFQQYINFALTLLPITQKVHCLVCFFFCLLDCASLFHF
ncbi:hypothetical protein RFI_35580 [Reticulomyxa filosa]|uniref:Uncharacterized protein n=1 Tax=Reticulomyxa filosa TaxID=46433 RepID=X6LJU3_RETFI|nr:hypothetical protein RFI_35580 [Reticulomyxa filosa]|eukprot:ETO01859.1 hypothetical protein RFI_35580 [Reticulomyxa filosa]